MAKLKHDINSIHKSDNFGKFKILSFKSGKGYKIKFLETGYERYARGGIITNGSIMDYLSPHISVVGYTGEPNMRIKYPKEYSLWCNMLARCYDKNNKVYHRYGGNGVTVDKRWHDFREFLKDIPNIKGYREDLWKSNKLQLDKDFRSGFEGEKTYSFETCMFMTHKENGRYQPIVQNYFKAISPEGDIYYHHNICEFSRHFDILKSRSINNVLTGKRGSLFNWKFEYIDKLPNGLTPLNINSQFENI